MKNKEYTITFNDKELNVMLKALGQRPFSEVYDLIEKIVRTTSGQSALQETTKKASAKRVK